MNGATLLRIAWFLAGLLLLSAILFTFTAPDASERPAADSYEPGGAAAFTELLRRAGYKVEVADTIPLYPSRDAILVAFLDSSDANLPEAPKDDESDESAPEVADIPPAYQYLRSHLEAGRSAILLPYDEDVKIDSSAPAMATVQDVLGRKYQLKSPTLSDAAPPQLAEATASFAPASLSKVGSNPAIPAYEMELVNGGASVYLGSGELAMNAYIDSGDNARFLLDAVGAVAPRGSKLIILDNTVTGGGEPGVLDLLGAWSKGALTQMCVLFAVVVFSLGKRFGQPDETRTYQAGARDLLEGIANTYTRARAGKAALSQIMEAQDRRVRRFLKLPVDSPRRKRNDLLPAALVNAFRAAEHLDVQDPTPEEALLAVRGLESEVNALLGPPRTIKAARHRVKSR